jgi:hypothetical protein
MLSQLLTISMGGTTAFTVAGIQTEPITHIQYGFPPARERRVGGDEKRKKGEPRLPLSVTASFRYQNLYFTFT